MMLSTSRSDLLKFSSCNSNQPDDWATYKRKKREVTNQIKAAKRTYFQESINKNKGNSKGIWKALKELSGTSKQTNKISEIKINNETSVQEPTEIAETLNSFFIDIINEIKSDGNEINQPIEFHDDKLERFVSSKIHDQCYEFNIPLITEKDVRQIIDKLSSNKATGPDGMNVRTLKLISPVFARPLTKLLNLSISSGKFPTEWKTAKVTPLFKSGPRDIKNNYRPISVLSILSKVLEKHVAKSLMNHLTENGLLYNLQSAFREGHSTETALIKLTDQIWSLAWSL